jgi:formylglycine-generating enzyme required for sulfatase activity
LRSRTGIASFDIPTEAQWEYACRAGNGWFWYNQTSYVSDTSQLDVNALKSIAWIYENASAVQIVGGKQPNAWGLYDMLGNAVELTLNWAGVYYPVPDGENDFVIDPKGPVEAREDGKKIWRGCSVITTWDWTCMGSREGLHRNTQDAVSGFRVVCDAVAK